MKPETQRWLEYAEQDEASVGILLQTHLYNPCLYHAQQAIEKYLKAVMSEREIRIQRIHSIRGLVNIFTEHAVDVDMHDDEIDLIDSIYMPARYPVGSVLPLFEPNQTICEQCLQIVQRIRTWAESTLNDTGTERSPEQPEEPSEATPEQLSNGDEQAENTKTVTTFAEPSGKG
jgi:HEPN domain-containing protein